MSRQDAIGGRCEAIAHVALTDFCSRPLPYFTPHSIGEKCRTFDYLVELEDCGATPMYFLAQVKGTTLGYTGSGRRLRIKVDSGDVIRIARCQVPAYLIGIDETEGRAFLMSLAGRRKAVSSMTTAYPLDSTTLGKLWNEVRSRWTSLPNPRQRDSQFVERR